MYYRFSCALIKEIHDTGVDTINVGTENEKSGMSYLKFILKAFPM